MPKVSVIMPCYNYGQYLSEAVDSVIQSTYSDFELIIVNDGSTDDLTIDTLKQYEHHHDQRITVIHRENGGLSCARNTGITASKGDLILLLDSDDLIGDTFIEKAVTVLDSNPEIGIVYCDVEQFGTLSGLLPVPEFSLRNMVMEVCITATALYRKHYWEASGGYDETMKSGMEDHDFWLSALELGAKPYKINETLFFYRKKEDSLSQRNAERLTTAYVQLFNNHRDFYSDNIDIVFQRMFSHFFIRLHCYVDTGNSFNPEECVDTVVRFRDGEAFSCEFDLSAFTKPIVALRFDPTEDYWSRITLSSLVLRNKNNSKTALDPVTLQHNGLRTEHVWTFHTTDPYFVFNGPFETQPTSISIDATMQFLSQHECDLVLAEIQAGDATSVKGSLKTLLKAIKSKLSRQ
jgi:glycosyltransferase involved in cell wall biosynthesis